MTRRLAPALVIVVLAAVAATRLRGQSTPDQQSTFRSNTDLVSVDVSVRAGDKSATGLRAEDFVLLDNNVRQRIESLEAARVPLDVSLVVDVSGGTPAWWGKPKRPAQISEELAGIVRKTSTGLRPDDRIRVLTIDTYPNEVVPLQAPGARLDLGQPVASNGLSSLHDTLIAAMVRRVEPGRRHLIVAITKTDDTISTADLATLQEVARRSEAVLHVVLGESLVGDTTCTFGCVFPRKRFWRPVQRRDELSLPAIAESTGGAFHGINSLGLFRSFEGTFTQVFNDFRAGYVLRYAPQGVKRDGWHEIVVKVPSAPSAVISARRGYAIEAPMPEARRPGGGNSSTAPTLESITAAFGRGDATAAEAALRRVPDLARLIRDFREAGNPWPANPHREAVMVLELAHAALINGSDQLADDVGKWLLQYNQLVRGPLGADAFECMWYWGELAAVEGAYKSTLGLSLATRALERCPTEPRLLLARARLTDQRWPLGTTWTRLPSFSRPSAEQLRDVPERYAAAFTLPSIAGEARVRAAWFAYRTGRFDAAVELLAPIDDTTPDVTVRYFHQLVRGQAQRALGRTAEAEAAWRAALTIWPGAESARVALMTLLASQGRRLEAEEIAGQIETAPNDQTDPWWVYWQGDYRAWPTIITRLGSLAK